MNKKIESNKEYNYGLLIIDAQEKIIRPIANKNDVIKNIKIVLDVMQILGKDIYVSEQSPDKLGSTISSLIPESNFKLFQKVDFSIGRNNKLLDDLSIQEINNLIVCGFETHICVQQSVCDFLREGYKTYIISDAMASRNLIDHEIGLQRMLAEGATIASSESIIFELCKTSSRKEFKQISNIVKQK